MKAVNLIPPEEQRRGPGGAGRSGGAVYVLLGLLGVLVIALVAYVLTTNAINEGKSQLARVTSEASIAQAQASALRPYRDFAQLRQKRVTTVAQLASNRFDWERTMRDLARVIPGDVWLTSLRATVSPSVQVGGGAGGGGGETGAIRGKEQVPAIEIVGCTANQAEVARVLTRLRLIQDVSRVTLVESTKSESQVSAGGASGGAASAGESGGAANQDCRHGSGQIPRFQLVVFFKPLPGANPSGGTAPGAAGSTAPPSASTPPAGSSSPPASSASTSSAPSSSAPGSSGSAPSSAAPAAPSASGGSR